MIVQSVTAFGHCSSVFVIVQSVVRERKRGERGRQREGGRDRGREGGRERDIEDFVPFVISSIT